MSEFKKKQTQSPRSPLFVVLPVTAYREVLLSCRRGPVQEGRETTFRSQDHVNHREASAGGRLFSNTSRTLRARLCRVNGFCSRGRSC